MRNELYPIFLKAHTFHILIVGGGEVGEEKLRNLLRSSPRAHVRLVAPKIQAGIYALAAGKVRIELIQEVFQEQHFEGMQLVIIATDNKELNAHIWKLAKARGILTNVADTPKLCDFYMGSIVTKGDLKIGISTNGQSPTFAKRFRQLLEESLPEDIPALLIQLKEFRNQLKGNFNEKVSELNKLTKDLVNQVK